MALEGLTTATGDRMIVSAGLIYLGNVQHGTIDGTVSFDPGMEVANIDYAGKTNPHERLGRVIRYSPTLSVNFKEITDTLLGLLMPGSTTVTATGVTTRTPPKAGIFLSAIVNVRAIFLLGNATYYEVRFARAAAQRGAVTGGAIPGTGLLGVTFTGLATDADSDAAPFTELTYAAPIPTVT